MNERRITARKPARLRRDVAGFGPIGIERSHASSSDAAPAPEGPVVKVTLVPAEADAPAERFPLEGSSGELSTNRRK